MSADGRCSKWTSGDLCFYMQAYCDHKVEQQYVLNNYVIATSQTGGRGWCFIFNRYVMVLMTLKVLFF